MPVSTYYHRFPILHLIVCLLLAGSGSAFSLRSSRIRNFRFAHQLFGFRLEVTEDSDPMKNQPGSFISPIPLMPSPQFQELAMSQLELLASSIPSSERPDNSKIKSMALYLPQENSNTGQLEFLPAILYPHPSQDRVFIANEADSGLAPALPQTLTTLPGFAHATSLLPDYPMVNGGRDPGVGLVEEVMCDLSTGASSLSVPLFSGSQTVGVLLVSPHGGFRSVTWTSADREKVGRAAKSLSLALSMDSERMALRVQNQQIAESLSNSLHQLKNPLQAMRTYGKLLQRRIAELSDDAPQLLEIAENLLIQSDRLADRIKPVDSIANTLSAYPVPLLGPASSNDLVHLPSIPWETETLEFARHTYDDSASLKTESPKTTGKVIEFSPQKTKRQMNNTDSQGSSPRSSFIFEMDLEMSFLDDVLDPILRAFQGIAIDQGIEFICEFSDDLSGVFICPEALQEAMVNVIDNAFSYVHLSGSNTTNPVVRVRLMANSPKLRAGVTILVEDNGPGIAPDDRERVFDRGYRSTAVKSSTEGSGIGLDIARTLVKGMGGTLEIQSRETYPDSLPGAVIEVVLYRDMT